MKTVRCKCCGSSTRFVFKVNNECFCSSGCLHHSYTDKEFRQLIEQGEATVINACVPGDNRYCFVAQDLYNHYERVKESYIK